MKKLYLYLVLMWFASQLCAQSYSGGSGTETDPYLISSNADMEALANSVISNNNYSQGKYFLLIQNISSVTNVIKNFQGTFDGNGYIIGTNIVNVNTTYSGLFGYVLNATIKNLGVSGYISSSTTVSGGDYGYTSGICAYASNVIIDNCFNLAEINASSHYSYVGGICGYAIGTTIQNCYNSNVIFSTGVSSYAGGICGFLSGSIINSYNTGIVNAFGNESCAGGICAKGSGIINNCHNNANIHSRRSTYDYSNYAGGICGITNNVTINNCYNIGNILSNIITVGTEYIVVRCYAGGICGINILNSYINNSFVASSSITGYTDLTYRITGGNSGTINNCYALFSTQINGTPTSSTDVTSKNGADAIITDIQSQSWITTNLLWDFENNWYIPTPTNYPLLKKQPNIHILSKIINYGETTIISSSNTGTPITYSLSDNTIASIQNNIITPLKAGIVTITASQASATEWTSENKDIILTINKKQVIVTANNNTMTYGDTSPTFTAQYSGFVNGDTETALSTLPTYSCNATSTSNVGTFNIVPSGAIAQNYAFTYENGILTIEKRSLTVTPMNTTRIYGSVNPSFTITYSGFVNGNTASVITTSPIANTDATQTSNVGSYEITCLGGSATNYSFSYQTGTLTVTKATLTAVADNKSRKYGEDNPTFTISYSGFKNTDNQTSLIQVPLVACVATKTNTVGNYPITLSSGDALNYNFVLTDGTLIINKAIVSINAQSTSSVYGENPPTFSCQYSGFLNGETESVLSTFPTMICSANSSSNVGTYNIVPSGAIAQNYAFTYENGILTIEKRSLTVTPMNTTRIYGSVNPSFTITYSGFVNGNTASVITTSPITNTDATLTSNVGTYDISCSGGSAANYSFSYQTGILTVAKATLTAVADNTVRNYGESNPTFTNTYYGFKNLDNQNSLSELPFAICQATLTSAIGDYPIVLSGGDAQNYDFSLINGTLTINKTSIIVTAYSASSIYGENIPTFNCQYSGFKNGESESILTNLPTISCNANSTSNVGTYPIIPSGALAQNYLFSYQNGTLTIEKHPLIVTPNNSTRTYGSVNPEFSFTYSGFVNGNTASVITNSPIANTDAIQTSDVGTYNITCSGGSSTNYSFTYGTGELNVNKAPLTIAAYNVTREQGEPNPVFTFSYSGFKNNENSGVLNELPVASSAANETSPVGYYEIVLSGGSDNNYVYNLVNGTMEVTAATGLEDISSNEFQIYPNPVCNELYFKSEKNIESISIYDIRGKKVMNNKLVKNNSINVSHLPQGIYILNILIDKHVIIRKIIKK